MEKGGEIIQKQEYLSEEVRIGQGNKEESEEPVAMGLGMKNRVWKDEEHLLYLVFLELNKHRTKSKLVRQ